MQTAKARKAQSPTHGAASRLRSRRSNQETQPPGKQRFFDILKDFKFLPGGRIQAGAGTARNVTLFNCFVMGTIEDSIPGIFRALQEGAVTMQQGGGIGCDFSTLRPRGTRAKGAGGIASGPVSFMDIWDAMCGAILSTGARRGAMMATLRCDHPDIEEFITAKQQPGRLRRFNLSVLVTDAFMAAVRADEDWPLLFPAAGLDAEGETIMREWSGAAAPVPCRVMRRVRARELWELILRSTYDYAEPGVLFIDRINQLNNLWYRERISATNPCGEIPLPPYGACDLGSLNLTQIRLAPFTTQGADRPCGARRRRRRSPCGCSTMSSTCRGFRCRSKPRAHVAHGASALESPASPTLWSCSGCLTAATVRSPSPPKRCARFVTPLIALRLRSRRRRARFPISSATNICREHSSAACPEDIQRRNRKARRPQQPSARDRADRHDQPARRQCLERRGADLCRRLRPQGARRRWKRERIRAHRLCARSVARDCRRRSGASERIRHRRRAAHPRPSRYAGGVAAIRRQFDFQDHQRAARLSVRRVPSRFTIFAYDKGLKGCTTFRPNPVTGDRAERRGGGARSAALLRAGARAGLSAMI